MAASPATVTIPGSASATPGPGEGPQPDFWWRACAWSGLVFVVGLSVSFLVVARFVPPPREHWTALQLAHFYRQHDTRIRLGMEGTILFACFYYFWTLAVARVMERTEGPDSPLTRIQVFGGLSTTWVVAASGLVFLIASFRAGQRSPSDIRLINDAGFIVINLTAMFTFFQVVAAGIAWLRADPEHSLVPRWVGYYSLLNAESYPIVFLIPFIQHGPFSWHGLFTFYGLFVVFYVWVVAVSWAMIRAMGARNRSRMRPPSEYEPAVAR